MKKVVILMMFTLLTLTVNSQSKIHELFVKVEQYNQKEQYDSSLHTLQGIQQLTLTNKDLVNLYNCYCNTYKRLKNYDMALYFYNKAIKLPQERPHIKTNMHYADIMVYKKNYKEAEKGYLKALEIAVDIKDTNLIAVVYGNLLSFYLEDYPDDKQFERYVDLSNKLKHHNYVIYANIGAYYQKNKNYNKAIEAYQKTLPLLESIDNQLVVKQQMAICWDSLHNYLQSHKLYGEVLMLKDKLYQQQNVEKMQEYAAKFELTNKTKDIELLNKENQYKTKQSIILLIGIVLALVLLILVYVAYKKVGKQKEIIKEQQKEVIASIRYAKRIQDALLPTEKHIQCTLNRLTAKV